MGCDCGSPPFRLLATVAAAVAAGKGALFATLSSFLLYDLAHQPERTHTGAGCTEGRWRWRCQIEGPCEAPTVGFLASYVFGLRAPPSSQLSAQGPCFLASHGAAARAHTIQPPGFVRDGCRMNAIQDVPLGVRPWQVKGGFFMVFTKDPSSNIGGKTRGAKKLRRGRGPRGTTCTETKKNEGSP